MEKDEEFEELKEIVAVETKKDEETVNIIFDGRQYSIRIPKRFAEKLGIDIKNDKFRFMLKVPPISEENPELTGEYVRG